uniref:Uncharacterized protein n=1 Tax=Oryza meridionalis TaxID=40149 RepID=A0A0E0CVI7_9ORYZ
MGSPAAAVFAAVRLCRRLLGWQQGRGKRGRGGGGGFRRPRRPWGGVTERSPQLQGPSAFGLMRLTHGAMN